MVAGSLENIRSSLTIACLSSATITIKLFRALLNPVSSSISRCISRTYTFQPFRLHSVRNVRRRAHPLFIAPVRDCIMDMMHNAHCHTPDNNNNRNHFIGTYKTGAYGRKQQSLLSLESPFVSSANSCCRRRRDRAHPSSKIDTELHSI